MFKEGDGQHPPIPERLSEEGQHFLKMCFVHDQRYRWTAHMLEDHPFVKVIKYSSVRCLFSVSCLAELKLLKKDEACLLIEVLYIFCLILFSSFVTREKLWCIFFYCTI